MTETVNPPQYIFLKMCLKINEKQIMKDICDISEKILKSH